MWLRCALLYAYVLFPTYVTEITRPKVSVEDLLDTYSISEEAKSSEPPNSKQRPYGSPLVIALTYGLRLDYALRLGVKPKASSTSPWLHYG